MGCPPHRFYLPVPFPILTNWQKPKTSGITFNVGTPDSNDSGDETYVVCMCLECAVIRIITLSFLSPFVEHEERSAIGSGSGLNPKAIGVPVS